MAASLSVNASAVVIKAVTDVTSRRRLLQSSITIKFKVVTTDANPSALAAKVQAQSDDESSLEQALIVGGLAITPGSLSIDPPSLGTEGEEELETLESFATLNFTSAAQVANALQQIAAVNATTSQGLQLTALSVAQALSNSSHVNADAIASALGILSYVASGSATGDVPVTLEAALNVTAALSFVVVAALDSNVAPAANLVVLQQVLQVVGNLTQSLLSSAAPSNSPELASQVDHVLQLTAAGVAQTLSNRSQVNSDAIASALGILSVVASGSPLSTVDLARATARCNSVAEALSAIVIASSPNNGTAWAANLTVLQQVMNVVDRLTQSLLLSAALDQTIPINSSDIQMALRVEGPNSTLFTQNLSAPGSGSSFEPLPRTLFAGVPSSSLVGVRTVFATFSFDPYSDPPDPNSTGITRLAFSSSDGKELHITNLTTPVYFSMPRLALVDGRKAQCQFWNTTALKYSTSGCVGLPDPQPPGHVIAWKKPTPNVTTDADMAGAWNISGALVDGNCSVRVLDCSLAEPGVVYPNPASPLTVPAVSCPPNTTTPMLVYSGSRCRLIQNNSLGCTWDNVKQAFVGAGCVSSGQPVQCACRHVRARADALAAALRSCYALDN